jgi:hypothetical protein
LRGFRAGEVHQSRVVTDNRLKMDVAPGRAVSPLEVRTECCWTVQWDSGPHACGAAGDHARPDGGLVARRRRTVRCAKNKGIEVLRGGVSEAELA